MAGTGILGGTFDPVHDGHLRLAIEVREALDLDCVRLIPLAVPSHRPAPQAAPAARVEMLQAAVAPEPGLVVDTTELIRGGVSYTMDTLTTLREALPDEALYLIVGMDAFCAMNTWHRWREIPELAHIVVACRPGSGLPAGGEVAAMLAARQVPGDETGDLGKAGRIFVKEIPELTISASRIRADVAAGRAVRYLVPGSVLDIIVRNGLYANADAG